MYALFARLYGTNNLPDSSNMCHESTLAQQAAGHGFRRASAARGRIIGPS